MLGSISYDSDPELAVNNYLNSSNGDINKLHEAVAASSDGSPNLQRIASLLQVNLSPANMTSPYVDVLKTQQMRLAEQPIYGSSRVGVASYWPGQYDAVWDYTTGTQDTLRLLGIKPWYSATLEGYKPAGSTEPYDNSSLGLASAAHLLGQKSYELSNHLGNVQATLSDKRYVQKQFYTASDSLRKGYAASVSSLYDYYPFGMLMKERCTSDTATQSVYASQVVYSPQYTTVNNAMTGASITSLNTTTQTNYNGSVNYFGQSASISKTLSNLQSGIPVSMKINLLYTNKPLYLTLQQGSTLLYSTTMNSSGTYSFNFTPTQSTVQLSIAYSYFNTNANTLCFTLDSVNYTQQNGSTSSTQLVQISSKQSDKYRFGYGDHEKMNEISGVGNTIDMGDRWLDTRIGRTPKMDAAFKEYPTISPYVYVLNNPINAIDPDGRVVFLVTGNLDFFGIFVGVGVSAGIAVGNDGIAFVGSENFRAGIGLEASASINFTAFPTMNSVNDLGGAGYGVDGAGAGAYGGKVGANLNKSGNDYGAGISYGVGVGAHLSGNVGVTAVKKISWQTLENFFNGFHNPDWPFGDYWSLEDRQEMKSKFILGLNTRRSQMASQIQANNKTVVANNSIINNYKTANKSERKKMQLSYNHALESNKKADASNKKAQEEIKLIDKAKTELGG